MSTHPERRAADVKLALLEQEQGHIKASVEQMNGEIKGFRSEYQRDIQEIKLHIAKQKGIIATISSVAVAVWGILLAGAAAIWEALSK